MKRLSWLHDLYLRIDARSLGLFRIGLALALLSDGWERFRHVVAFYTNDGVLPNHNHLFHLLRRDPPERVWSLFHAFSTPGEARFLLILTFIVYLCLLVGVKTRVFQALSVVLFVSLVGRNRLLEDAGTSATVGLLLFSLLLPLGARFSIDSLARSYRETKEKDAEDLNAPLRTAPLGAPVSLAALGLLVQLAVILLATRAGQSGEAWHDGSAIHRSLWLDRWVSDVGIRARALPEGLLSGWTRGLRFAEVLVPILMFVPLPRIGRSLAILGLWLIGLTYTCLWNLGIFGPVLLAASALLVPTALWDRTWLAPDPARAITVIYDADCGICLWLTRLLRRLDLRGHLTFQGNDALARAETPPAGYRIAASAGEATRVLFRRTPPERAVEIVALPEAVTDERAASSVIVVDAKGEVHEEGRAIAAIVRALPLGAVLSLPLRIPGTQGLWSWLYRLVPPRRFAISEAVGLAACGVPAPRTAEDGAPPEQGPSGQGPSGLAPSTRLRNIVSGAAREASAAVLLFTVWGQATHANAALERYKAPDHGLWRAVAGWTRMQETFSVWSPEPPAEDVVWVVDAMTRGGSTVDLLSGKEPDLETPSLRLGPLWASYLARIRTKEWSDFDKAFRDFLIAGGRLRPRDDDPNAKISGLDAYTFTFGVPAPGQGGTRELVAREKVFTHQRGGRESGKLPLIRPGALRP